MTYRERAPKRPPRDTRPFLQRLPLPLGWLLFFAPLVLLIVVITVFAALIIPGGSLLQAHDCFDGQCHVTAFMRAQRIDADHAGVMAYVMAVLFTLLAAMSSFLVVSRVVWLRETFRGEWGWDADRLTLPLAAAALVYLAFDTALVWGLEQWLF